MISIAMTYYNRFELLKNTLKSISKFTHPYEIILVDDASTKEPLTQELVSSISYGLNIKFFRFTPEEKTWHNPCIAFNKAFSLCSGNIIIIQNGECYHNNDIVNHCEQLNFENDYHVFGCYSLPENSNPETHILSQRLVSFCGDDGWYQHSRYRPLGYHFTSAISKKNLFELKGFDENYADGNSYDDNEFLYRIKQKLNVNMIDDFYTSHQFHYSGDQSTNVPSNVYKYTELVNGTYSNFKSSL